jgi:hypothetical protein
MEDKGEKTPASAEKTQGNENRADDDTKAR